MIDRLDILAPRLCGLANLAIGLTAIAGWLVGSRRLAGAGFSASYLMSPTSAAICLVLGATLVAMPGLEPRRARWAAFVSGGAVSAAATLRLIVLIGGFDFPFDQWLLNDWTEAHGFIPTVNLPAALAVGFLLVGSGLALCQAARRLTQRVGQYLLASTLLIAATVVVGHIYREFQFSEAAALFPMSLASAMGLFLLATGALALLPDRGFLRILVAPNLGGAMARRLLPIIVISPVAVGLMSLALARWAGTDPIGGVGTLVALTGLVLAIAVLAISSSLERTAESLVEHMRDLEIARYEADSANRAKSEFLANMSHELRTPLNAVIGFSQILRDASFGPLAPRYRDYANDILSSGFHLLAVVNDILDLAKIEAQRMTLDCAPTNIPDLVAQCITFVQERATAGGICVATEIAPDFPPLDLDETRFKQILLNLLSNSVKFTRPGGSVTLTARIAPEGPEFQVIDTGIGMTEDEVAIALTPFRQVDSALSRRDQGTGLGLPLAAALIERHGGALAIESMPGVGTTATIRLPRERVLTTGLDGREAAMR